MSKFVLTAQLQLQAPTNTRSVINQLRSQLQGQLNIPVSVTGSVQATKQIKQVTQQTQQATTAAHNMGKAFGASIKRFAAFNVATRAVGLLASKLSQAVDEAIEFQRQLVKISQVTGKTIGQLKGLTDEITRLSTTLGVSSTALLSTTRILAQAGIQAGDLKVALEALAKTTLAPTFDNITQTAEGAVAILAQFGQGVGALEQQLGAINAVAGQFAVESGDLISSVRRMGGVFVQAGGDLNELLALFTSVRATTRENAESISTGLRTIFTRIQRPQTIEYLKQFGVELVDLNGKFIGPYEAVRELSKALAGLDRGDIRFVEIAEQLGGFRQIGKVIPLLQQFEVAERARQAAIAGGNSLNEDAVTAQQALAVQIEKTREKFVALIRSISETSTFRIMIQSLLGIAEAFIKVADAIKPIIPLIAAFGAFKLAKGIGGFASGLGAGVRGKNQGGKIHAFASGGSVPGTGNRDTVPAMLTPGEFVIRKSSVSKIGADNLAAMNDNGYAAGGKVQLRVKSGKFGGLFLTPPDGKDSTISSPGQTVTGPSAQKLLDKLALEQKGLKGTRKDPAGKGSETRDATAARGALLYNKSVTTGFKPSGGFASFLKKKGELPTGGKFDARPLALERQFSQTPKFKPDNFSSVAIAADPGAIPALTASRSDVNQGLDDEVTKIAFDGVKRMVTDVVNSPVLSQGVGPRDLKQTKQNIRKSVAQLFNNDPQGKINSARASIEGYLFEGIIGGLSGVLPESSGSVFDFLDLGRGDMEGWGDLFGTAGAAVIARMRAADAKRSSTQSNRSSIVKKVGSYLSTTPERLSKFVTVDPIKMAAAGGPISGSDTVPAMLTPGEFVVNKKASQSIGYGNLNKMNKQGVVGFASGGPVEVQHFASGSAGTGVKPSGGVSSSINVSFIQTGLDKVAVGLKLFSTTVGQSIGVLKNLSVIGEGAKIAGGSFTALNGAISGVPGFITQLGTASNSATNSLVNMVAMAEGGSKGGGASKSATDGLALLGDQARRVNQELIKLKASIVNLSSLSTVGEGAKYASESFRVFVTSASGVPTVVTQLGEASRKAVQGLNGIVTMTEGAKKGAGASGGTSNTLDRLGKAAAGAMQQLGQLTTATRNAGASAFNLESQFNGIVKSLITFKQTLNRLNSKSSSGTTGAAGDKTSEKLTTLGGAAREATRGFNRFIAALREGTLVTTASTEAEIVDTQADLNSAAADNQEAQASKGAALGMKLMTVSMLGALLPAVDENSGAIHKAASGMVNLLTQLSFVIFALEAFGVKLSTQQIALGGSIALLTGAAFLLGKHFTDITNSQLEGSVKRGESREVIAGFEKEDRRADRTALFQTIGTGIGATVGGFLGATGAGTATAATLFAAPAAPAAAVAGGVAGAAKGGAAGFVFGRELSGVLNILEDSGDGFREFFGYLDKGSQALLDSADNIKKGGAFRISLALEEGAVKTKQALQDLEKGLINASDAMAATAPVGEAFKEQVSDFDALKKARAKEIANLENAFFGDQGEEAKKVQVEEDKGLQASSNKFIDQNKAATTALVRETILAGNGFGAFQKQMEESNSGLALAFRTSEGAVDRLKLEFENQQKAIAENIKFLEALNFGLETVTGKAMAVSGNLDRLVASQEAGYNGFEQAAAVLEQSLTTAAAKMDSDDIEAAQQTLAKTLRSFGADEATIKKATESVKALSTAQTIAGDALSEAGKKLAVGGQGGPEEIKKEFIEQLSAGLDAKGISGPAKQKIIDGLGKVEFGSEEVQTQLKSGNFQAIIDQAFGPMSEEIKKQVLPALQERAKQEKVLIDLTKQRIKLEKAAAEAQKKALDISLEAAQAIADFGGRAVTTGDKVNILNKKLNIDLAAAGVRGTGGGTAQDLAAVQQNILANFNAQENAQQLAQGKRAVGGPDGAFGGVEGVEEDKRPQLKAAQDALIDFSRQRIALIKEELDIIKKKNALEKSSLEKLLGGDIEGFFKDQAAVGAASALRTGNEALLGSFGATAIGAGFTNLQDQNLPAQDMARIGQSALGALGVQDTRSAQILTGATAEEQRLQREGQQFAGVLGVAGQTAAEMAEMEVKTKQITIKGAVTIMNQGAPQSPEEPGFIPVVFNPTDVRPGFAKGGMVYASRGMFVPRGTDTVPAMLTPGEFVVNRAAVNTGNNLATLQAMNSSRGSASAMSRGGTVYAEEGGFITDIFNSMFGATDKIEKESAIFQKNLAKSYIDVFKQVDRLHSEAGRGILKTITGSSDSAEKNKDQSGFGISSETLTKLTNVFSGFSTAVDKLSKMNIGVKLDPTEVNVNFNNTTFLASLKDTIKSEVLGLVRNEIEGIQVTIAGNARPSNGSVIG